MTSTGVRVRAALDAIPLYVPGRSPEQVAAAFGIERVVKLASNEAAAGPLPGVLDEAARRSELTHLYPDTDATALRTALGDRHGLALDRVVVGSGSVTLLQQLIAATCVAGDEVVFGWRSFEAYATLTAVAGVSAVAVPLTADARHDLPAMAAAVTDRTRLILVCSPNNPTGTTTTAAELEEFLARVPATIPVVLDEAYLEYADPAVSASAFDGLEVAGRHSNVVVLRTFSKAYGLAGLRVGWCAAPPELAVALRRTALPFAVNSVAQQAALLTLERAQEVHARAAAVVAERARVTAALRGLGLAVPDSGGNFVWMAIGSLTPKLAVALERRGVIARPYASEGLRVTIGQPEENDLFLAVLPAALDAAREPADA